MDLQVQTEFLARVQAEEHRAVRCISITMPFLWIWSLSPATMSLADRGPVAPARAASAARAVAVAAAEMPSEESRSLSEPERWVSEEMLPLTLPVALQLAARVQPVATGLAVRVLAVTQKAESMAAPPARCSPIRPSIMIMLRLAAALAERAGEEPAARAELAVAAAGQRPESMPQRELAKLASAQTLR